ncbi:MAG: DUF2796 domain-containing protein [Pseudomonadota bacterium]
MRLSKTAIVLAIAALGLNSPAFAADDHDHDDDHQEHKAHEHGVGILKIAIEGEEIEMMLEVPGADIVGFEHAAETSDDKAAVLAAAGLLRDGSTLFKFPEAAECKLEEADVESSLLASLEGDHDHHDHDPKKADAHDHGHKEEHDDHSDEGGEGHAEFHVHYHFHCHNTAALKVLETTYFDTFPNARELDVQAIGPNGQTAVELTKSAALLEF